MNDLYCKKSVKRSIIIIIKGTPNKMTGERLDLIMNILQLCKAAERFEMLCMMNFNDSDISRAAVMVKVPFGVLRELITAGDETSDRGSRFASMVHRDEELVMRVLLHDSFYEIWETIVNS